MESEATLIRRYQLKNHSRGEHDQVANPFCGACDEIRLAKQFGIWSPGYTPYIPRYLRRKPRRGAA